MKQKKNLVQAFRKNEFGMVDYPKKISGTQISRLLLGDHLGCAHCFPHGCEVVNARWNKVQRSWKSHRKTQWKE